MWRSVSICGLFCKAASIPVREIGQRCGLEFVFQFRGVAVQTAARLHDQLPAFQLGLVRLGRRIYGLIRIHEQKGADLVRLAIAQSEVWHANPGVVRFRFFQKTRERASSEFLRDVLE